jgi:uncharacterized membrane protein
MFSSDCILIKFEYNLITICPVKTLTLLVILATFFCSCENNSTDDLTDATPIDNVTYTEHVKTIINNNCIICHGTIPANSAPMSLVTYDQVKQAVQERGLLDRISRAQGEPGMMPNGGTRLPQNQIDLIVQWEEQGLQE